MFQKICVVVLITLFLPVGLISAQSNTNKNVKVPEDASERYKSLETLARGLYYIETLYVDADKVKRDVLMQNALQGVVEKLDPHTMILPKEAFKQMTMDTQGKFGGVGIIVSQERGKLLVVSPIEDTPAFKAGIKAGDEILAIDNTPTEKLKDTDAAERMRGVPGSVLKLTIKREGEKKNLTFKLTREIIKIKSVRSETLEDSLLYARISSFQENTADELFALLNKNKGKIKGFVLDLRDNPGGLLDQAVKISDMFIESGVIVSTVGRGKDRVEREFAHKRDTFMGFPMVVLVNGGSASASEIVAGALQDHERAMILGTKTFGKGSVQTLVSLPDGSGLKLTVARYYTPKDRSIQAKGIEPDIVVSDKRSATTDDSQKKTRSEADLSGHIESGDLSEMSNKHNFMESVKNWPKAMQDDTQLLSAFSYLKSWSIFKINPRGK